MKRSFLLIPVLTLAALACTGCSNLRSISVTPVAGSVTLTAVGQTAQFKAVGTYQTGSAPTTTGDATTSVLWSSSSPAVATIDKNGLATAVGAGKTTITADSGHDGIHLFLWPMAGLIISLAIAFSIGERRAGALFGAATLGASTGLLALLQLQYLVIACRDSTEWVGLGALGLVGIFTVLAMPVILARQQLYGLGDEYNTKVTRFSLLVFTACAAIAGLLLMPKALVLQPLSLQMPSLSGFFYNLDGRYRDFPLAIYLLPVLQLTLGLRLAGLSLLSTTSWGAYRYLIVIALVTMVVFHVSEPLNVQAYAWSLLVLLLAVTTWPRRLNQTIPSVKSV